MPYKLRFVLPEAGHDCAYIEQTFVMLLSRAYDARVRAGYRCKVAAWNSGDATWLDLEWIFGLDCGRPQMSRSDHVETVLALGKQKLVPARVVRLIEPPLAKAAELDRLLSRHRYHDADHGQGPEKRQSLYWLQRRGAQTLHAEGDYIAGRYDVAAEDLGVLVECGTTRIDKLLKTSLSSEWREFVIIPRGLNVAVVFDFTAPVFTRLRHFAERARDRIRFLERVCQEPRITKKSLSRCLAQANDAYAARCRNIAAIMDTLRGSVSFSAFSTRFLEG